MSNADFMQESQNSQKLLKNKKQSRSPSKVQYKGITLKEYFRLCDRAQENPQIDEIDEQSRASSQQSAAQTPSFGIGQPIQAKKFRSKKIKTEIEDVQNNQVYEKNGLANNSNFNNGVMLSHEKNQDNSDMKGMWNVCQQFYKKTNGKINQHNNGNYPPERKRVVSIPSRSNKQFMNRSTLASFYQLEKKKKKMLNKLKAQKEKVNESQLSDAFFVTKYAFKFKLDKNNIK